MRKSNKKPTNIGAVILAGGLGTRMKSENPKALSSLLENPLIFYTIKSLIEARKEFNARRGINKSKILLDKIGTVIGHKGELVKNYLLKEKRFKKKGLSLDFCVQDKYLGTGDAVKKALDMFPKGAEETDIIILPCDMPLIKPETFVETIKFHLENGNDLTVLSVEAENPYSYGRILRDEKECPKRIIEEKELCDYPPETALIKEINSGVYIVKLNLLRKFIKNIQPGNRKKEYYFTDIVNIFYEAGLKTACYKSCGCEEFAGVNSKLDLFNAQKILQKRLIKDLMINGVNFISDDNVYIGYNVKVGEGSVIYPGVFISGKTLIFKDVIIENGCVIKDSSILNNAKIKSYSVIENSIVMDDVQVGPFARLRPETFLAEGSRIGNFVEVKKSFIGRNTKASHLSYIGDAIIGDGVNIGAGVITCNYDGEKKYKTIIEDGCFIGSDSQLVAPVKVGKNSYVGSGTTVTKDVPEGALAISRTPQRNIEGWALKKMKVKKGNKGDN
ncbi:MAG: bifunctional UDP-N-acetylglucosamine diphosphorylase/glucosamine-1-phosphate N-acetyltransferase GlmU [bacterium]